MSPNGLRSGLDYIALIGGKKKEWKNKNEKLEKLEKEKFLYLVN